MKFNYDRCRKVWDEVFAKENKVRVPEDATIGNSEIDAGLDWLCQGTDSILDFGCGNGSLLFYCALRGTRRHLGIDLSEEGIKLANRRKEKMTQGEFEFRVGDVSAIATIEGCGVDAVILSNIVDNLVPGDAVKLLEQVYRVLRAGGKALIKLNPFLEQEQIQEWGIKVIEGNLLDDGLLLWNQTTEEWTILLEQYFDIRKYLDVYYEQHKQFNRLFLVTKRP